MDINEFRASPYVGFFTSHMENPSVINPDLLQVRNVRSANFPYDQSLVSVSFTGNYADHRDWTAASCASGSAVRESNNQVHSSAPLLVAEVLSSNSNKARCNNDYHGYKQDFANQWSFLNCENASAWMSRVPAAEGWSGDLGLIPRASDPLEGLRLSLSSNPGLSLCTPQQGGYDLQEHNLMVKPSVISKSCGKSVEDAARASGCSPHAGPLGPFTGYATILKSSRFLKVAQELLDEFCVVRNPYLVEVFEKCEELSREVGISGSATQVGEMEAGAKGNGSANTYASILCGSPEVCGNAGSSNRDSCVPEHQEKRAKLLYLLEEVNRRYKIYHQQMQMVVSSFESVPGLRAATPYVSLALKTVMRNFRRLKSFIFRQINCMSKAQGEDILLPTTSASISRSDMSILKLNYSEQSIQKHKFSGANVGLLEPQQHSWRPQRGLPERAVAILKGWLFDHFLHPYPTDADKHMLATQTGLSRSQVSNWFINARVRVWKPMVEEIHMLEKKGLAKANQDSSKNDAEHAIEGTIQPKVDDDWLPSCLNSTLDQHPGCSEISSAPHAEQCNQEKRSRVDFRVPLSMDGSLFMPWHQSRFEKGGIGAVSLTLDLKPGVESARRQQQFQQQGSRLLQQFGGQMIHDFVG